MGSGPSTRLDRDARIDSVNPALPFTSRGKVGLRTHHNTYLSSQDDKGARANSTHLLAKEKWTMHVQQDTGLVAFSSYWQDGDCYLCAMEDGNCHADGDIYLHGGCYWTMIDNGDGTFSFRSTFGKYLTAEPPNHSGPRQVLADRDPNDIWQKFHIDPTRPSPATPLPW